MMMMKVKVTANVVSFILLLLGRPVNTALDLLVIVLNPSIFLYDIIFINVINT